MKKTKKVMDFLNSIGVDSGISSRGEKLDETVISTLYAGVKWFRTGYEGPTPVEDQIMLHYRTGAKMSYGLCSGGSDIDRLLKGAEELARHGALLSLEGANEPNNWSIRHNGKEGGKNLSWLPVAEQQAELYARVKAHPTLKNYPVFDIGGETGAQTDNCGMQFLTIPKGANTLMPDGTTFADYANVHNYFCHPSTGGMIDNQTWHAADPLCDKVPGNGGHFDGIYGNYAKTWLKGFDGYSDEEILKMPRVVTETGVTIGSYNGQITERIQGCMVSCMFLDQFYHNYDYSALYILRDRVDENGNQTYGMFRPDNSPRLAADYMHNMTTILRDFGKICETTELKYEIKNQPETVHDMVLQKANGKYYLIIWGERFTGGKDEITINFDKAINANIYDITAGTNPIEIINNKNSISLTMTDHAVIIELQ